MTERTSRYLVPFTLGVMALGVFCLAGCRREGPKPRQVFKADPPSVYMKDPAFRAQLDQQNAERNELAGTREKLMVELESRVDAMRAKLKGADDQTVKRELEKDPEWNSLARRIRKLNEALEDNRAATTEIVSERLKARPVESGK